MAEEFDKDRAFARQREILRWVQEPRNILTKDVIDYYWEKVPETEEKNQEYREDMRKYLRDARDHINRLLDGDLS